MRIVDGIKDLQMVVNFLEEPRRESKLFKEERRFGLR